MGANKAANSQKPMNNTPAMPINSAVSNPADHPPRHPDKTTKFEFIREKVSDLYCPDNGRPALDPVVLFKMLLIGYLFGVRSERQLVREIEANVAYRRFPGLGLRDKAPDHSTLAYSTPQDYKSFSHAA